MEKIMKKIQGQRLIDFESVLGVRSYRRVYDDELGRLRLAHQIAGLREKCGLTQAQLADKVGTTQAGISRLENPEYRNYSLTTLEKVAAIGTDRIKLEEASKGGVEKITAARSKLATLPVQIVKSRK